MPILDFECPYRVLIGPLYQGSLLGPWLNHPNIRSFHGNHDIHITQYHHTLKLESDMAYDLARDSFADLLARLPADWEPDVVIWYNLSLMAPPPGIEDCPYPTVAIIHDWPLNFQSTLDYAQAFDYVLADRAFLEVLAHQGFEQAAYWNCYAHDPMQSYLLPGLERIYDIAFLGNVGYHYHRERNPWLERLLQLGDRYRVLISDRYYRDDYTRFLNQSKIVFNHSIRGEMNMRSFEAVACGALLFCEEDNLEIRDFLTDGVSCVLYNADNLEEKLIYYLEHPQERQAIAMQGVLEMSQQSAAHQFQKIIQKIPDFQAAFAADSGRVFKQFPVLKQNLIRARHMNQCLMDSSPLRSLEILNQTPCQTSEEHAHLSAVRGALRINQHWNVLWILKQPQLSAELKQDLMLSLQELQTGAQALPHNLWHHYNQACAYSSMHMPQAALALWQQVIPRLEKADIDFAELSTVHLLPRGRERNLHEFNYLWDKTAANVLRGLAPRQALNKLLLWQAFELSGYCLMWLNQKTQAIQAFQAASQLGPGSYYTYTPLLSLLHQSGQTQALLMCQDRAIQSLGLIENFHRDRILALLQQASSPQRQEQLQIALKNYRLLLSYCQGGRTRARDSIYEWIPDILLWLVELIESRMQPLN